MTIAIDARMYGVAQRGIGRYLVKLLEHLERVDTKNHYTMFLRRTNFEEYQPSSPNFTKALWDAPWYGIREQLFFKKLFDIRNSKLDISNSNIQYPISNIIYHFPHWNIPLFFNSPFVVTIHDLELFSSNRNRDASTRGRLTYTVKHLAFKAVFRHAVLGCRAIIVPSHAVQEQLLDMYPQVRSKVQVIYEAPTISPDIRYSPPKADSPRAKKLDINQSKQTPISNIQYPISEHFVLYVGAAYPHKNLARLLEAWGFVREEFPDYKLVLVGREDFFWKKLKEQWRQFVISTKRAGRARGEISRTAPKENVRSLDFARDDELGIVFYGEATDEELAALYKNAVLLVQPSLEEGFSLPPLEALAHGCPVAVSDIPVHHEILGDAALYFDPLDPRAMAAAIQEMLTNPRTRDRILHKAKSQLLRYSWRTAAQATLQIYESV